MNLIIFPQHAFVFGSNTVWLSTVSLASSQCVREPGTRLLSVVLVVRLLQSALQEAVHVVCLEFVAVRVCNSDMVSTPPHLERHQ